MWNHQTSIEMIAEFQSESSLCKFELLKAIDEANDLKDDAASIDVPVDRFEAVSRLEPLRELLRTSVDPQRKSSIVSVAGELSAEFENDQSARIVAFDLVRALKPNAFPSP